MILEIIESGGAGGAGGRLLGDHPRIFQRRGLRVVLRLESKGDIQPVVLPAGFK